MIKSVLYGLLAIFIFESCSETKKTEQATELATAPVATAKTQEVPEHFTPHSEPALVQQTDGQEEAIVTEQVVISEKTQAEVAPSEPVVQSPVTQVSSKFEEDIKAAEPSEVVKETLKPDHRAWGALLRKYVSPVGQVNYKGFKADRDQLDKYLMDLKNHPIQSSWNRNEKLAYWTNAYNAFTVDLIVRNYPLKSIMNLDKPWDTKFIQIDGNNYSLNQIEHEVVRPSFKDPRIHFAFVCAAKSCPKLLNAAYLPETIHAQFDQQTSHFINQSGKNKISADVVGVSQLFNWYGDDFKTKGSIIDYLNEYVTTKINADARVEFLEYDWALNE